MAALDQHRFETAADVLSQATGTGQLHAASLLVRHGQQQFDRSFGQCKSQDDMFLIASISKPMAIAAVMTLYTAKEFALDDPVVRFLPEFRGDFREQITMRQLFTHVSGLPDQLPENAALRARHAPLADFVRHALTTPLLFKPGSKYSYSSMGILLAAEVAQRMSGKPFHEFMRETVFDPLGMKRSALGLGKFKLTEMMRCQVEAAAKESGAGNPEARDWDWNSPYWRNLGSPWGGVNSSANDVARFLDAFLTPGDGLHPEIVRLMIRNHNRQGSRPRGLGFALGPRATSPGCSAATFGHGGSTGTLAWADPRTDTVCVVLTTLPSGAADPHPRQRVSDLVAAAVAEP